MLDNDGKNRFAFDVLMRDAKTKKTLTYLIC